MNILSCYKCVFVLEEDATDIVIHINTINDGTAKLFEKAKACSITGDLRDITCTKANSKVTSYSFLCTQGAASTRRVMSINDVWTIRLHVDPNTISISCKDITHYPFDSSTQGSVLSSSKKLVHSSVRGRPKRFRGRSLVQKQTSNASSSLPNLNKDVVS